MRDILVGVDVGTTVLKAAAFEEGSGRALARAGHRLRVRTTPDGGREQAPRAIDVALKTVFAELAKQLGTRWRGVAGIGLAAQGGSTIIANRRTGRALTAMWLWNDTRTFAYTARATQGTTPAFWRRHTLRDAPGAGLGRMLWLKENRPDLLTSENIYVGAGEYACFRLTGLWRQDAGSALQVGCYNARRHGLDQELLDLVGLPISLVAPMRDGHTLNPLTPGAARAFGLTPGIPVAGPYMDHEAGFLSAVGVSKRPLQCSLGTAWVGNLLLPPKTKWTSPFQLVVPAVVGSGALVVQPLMTGNIAWDWALEQFVNEDHDRAIGALGRLFAQALLPPPGLVALPWFNVGNPLNQALVGGGTFYGMNLRTRKSDLVRALAVALVCEMERVFAAVRQSGQVDAVVLGGGASRGPFFQRLFAALFHPLPVLTMTEDLSGPRGALYALDHAVARARTRSVALPPVAARDGIRRAREEYRQVFDRLYAGSGAGGAMAFG